LVANFLRACRPRLGHAVAVVFFQLLENAVPAETLLQLTGADITPARLNDACLVLIDLQNEYLAGPVAAPDAGRTIRNTARLLSRARDGGSPIVHIVHRGRPGRLFDRDAERGQIATPLAPSADERVTEKTLPNAFAGTELHPFVVASDRRNIILVGLMTHMCISSTARAALDLGLRTTIASDCCASRDLPDRRGGIIPAQVVHDVALAELADRFAVVAHSSEILG
jgi:nicotinamidase-related amidase